MGLACPKRLKSLESGEGYSKSLQNYKESVKESIKNRLRKAKTVSLLIFPMKLSRSLLVAIKHTKSASTHLFING